MDSRFERWQMRALFSAGGFFLAWLRPADDCCYFPRHRRHSFVPKILVYDWRVGAKDDLDKESDYDLIGACVYSDS